MNEALLNEYIIFLQRELEKLEAEIQNVEIGDTSRLAECWKIYIRLHHNIQFLRLIEHSFFPRSTLNTIESLQEDLHTLESKLNLIRPQGLGDAEIEYLRSKSHAALLDAEFRVSSGSSNVEEEEYLSISDSHSQPRRVRRRTLVQSIRQSIPVQALALILLGFASLIPMTEDEFGCLVSNNLGTNILQPSLTFLGGAPPI